MLATFPASVSPVHSSAIVLKGVQWLTFQTLVSELQGESTYRVAYDPQTLTMEIAQPDSAIAQAIVTLNGVSWPSVRSLLTEVGEQRAWRVAYDRGVLELRMPSIHHEEPKELIVDFVTVMVDELGIEMRKLGALTLERDDLQKAVEPDTCFYIQNEHRVRGLETINLDEVPPPDLVVESDYTHSSLDKLAIYAALGVPELWRYHKRALQVYQRVDGHYIPSDRSLAFPLFPIADIPDLIEKSKEMGQRAVIRLFRQQIQTIMLKKPG
jgi:Uma2 family endonuclease